VARGGRVLLKLVRRGTEQNATVQFQSRSHPLDGTPDDHEGKKAGPIRRTDLPGLISPWGDLGDGSFEGAMNHVHWRLLDVTDLHQMVHQRPGFLDVALGDCENLLGRHLHRATPSAIAWTATSRASAGNSSHSDMSGTMFSGVMPRFSAVVAIE